MEFLYKYQPAGLSRAIGMLFVTGSVAMGSHAAPTTQIVSIDHTVDSSRFDPARSTPVLNRQSVSPHSSGNQGLSLQQTQDLALQSQPLQQLWQQRRHIAEANVLQSNQRRNPQLLLEQTGFKNTQEREASIAIAQQLDIFGERKTRQQLAGLQLEQDSVRRLTDEAELRLAVTIAYWQLAQAEWALELAGTQQQLSLQGLMVARKRLQAGRIAEVDYQRVHIAHQNQVRQWQAAQAQCALARQQLGQF